MHIANTATIDVLGLLTEKTVTGSWAGSISPHKDLPASNWDPAPSRIFWPASWRLSGVTR